jgi:hypothetical protein
LAGKVFELKELILLRNYLMYRFYQTLFVFVEKDMEELKESYDNRIEKVKMEAEGLLRSSMSTAQEVLASVRNLFESKVKQKYTNFLSPIYVRICLSLTSIYIFTPPPLSVINSVIHVCQPSSQLS